MSEVDDFAVGASPLDRQSSTPLWAQLERELRRRLDDGHFGRRFPTDRELMQVYQVSRHTARHAIGQLGADGMVRRARGVGTSLDRSTLTRSLGSLYSLRQLIEETGVAQSSNVLALEVVTDADVAGKLELDPRTEFVHLHRVRFAGDRPIAVDHVWMPLTVASELLDVDFTNTSLYDEFERAHGRRPNEGWETITPTIPGAELRQMLDLDDAHAAFLVQRLGRLDGRPVEWRTTVVRGDRFTLVADWSAGQRNDIRVQLTGTDG